jgi:glucose-6-phosphate isomerase
MVLNELHKETLQALAESEKKELEFQLAMAEDVWLKVKGYPIPDSYSIKDRLEIFERYYHRAVSQSQGE